MTTSDKLAAIQEACVAVNRELVPDCKAVAGELSRPIGLVDLMLAIRNKFGYGQYAIDETGCFWKLDSGEAYIPTVNRVEWELFQDDLAAQSPETLTFLYDLLCLNNEGEKL